MRLKPFAPLGESRGTPHLKAIVTGEDFSSTSNLGPALALEGDNSSKRASRIDQSLACEMEIVTPAMPVSQCICGTQIRKREKYFEKCKG